MELKEIENDESAQAYVSKSFHPPSPLQKGFKKLGVGLVILAVLLGTGWFLQQQGILSNLTLTAQQVWQELFSSESQPTIPQAQIPAAQVTITTQGFVPQTILLKKGSGVIWTNTDNKPHQIASDPHPTHSLLPTLGKGKILSPASSFTLTFNKTGTFTYHDEENPLKFKGVVIVR